jgi:hypothetical protein
MPLDHDLSYDELDEVLRPVHIGVDRVGRRTMF